MADPDPTVQNGPQPSNPAPPASGFTPIGNELDPTAPLWKVYGDEVRKLDQTVYFEELNKTLDTLLIFSGLFSAVVTSFVIASFPLLTPGDQTDVVVNAILALAMAINSSITLPTPKPPEPVTAASTLVNGLWFISLFIALAVAFVAILAKQWFGEYRHIVAETPSAFTAPLSPSVTSEAPLPELPAHSDRMFPVGTSMMWVRRRRSFLAAYNDAHIPVLITLVLPLLLHVALFLFLLGLCVFVWTPNKHIALGMSVLTVLLFGLYMIATIVPIFLVDFPTASPLVRRARGRGPELPTWIVIKALQLWRTILSLVLGASGSSRITLGDVDGVMTALHQRQRYIRGSYWLGEQMTDEDVKWDTLRWLIVDSGSEAAITAAFQALGALPYDSPILPRLRVITVGMDTAVRRLVNSLTPPTAIDIILAVRSELVLGRGSWNLPRLGVDLSPSLTRTLIESQHPEAGLISAAMRLDDKPYFRVWEGVKLSFSSLYDITDASLRGDRRFDSCQSTLRLLLTCPGISVSAFACLSVLLATQSLHLDDSDTALIFRIFDLLRGSNDCGVYDEPHECVGLCVVVFVVRYLDVDDPANRRIVPIILSHLLPCLMPELKSGNGDLVPRSIYRNRDFFEAIARSDWLHSPPPAGNTDLEVLSTLLSRFDWSDDRAKASRLQILEWFMFRGLYGTLRSPSLIAKVQETRTCEADKRPSMLRDLCQIVHRIKDPNVISTTDDDERLNEFVSSLILLCKHLSPYSDKESRDILFKRGLIPELGACLKRMPPYTILRVRLRVEFFDMVDAALGSLDGQVENKEEYLLHVAQHCVGLDTDWTRREAVRAHLDPRQMERRLAEQGPCTKCTEGSTDKWSDEILDVLRARSPTVKQDPQPDPPPAAPSTSLAASAPAALLLTAYRPDVASVSSPLNAISAFRVEPGPIPMLQAATGSGPVSSNVGFNPAIASLSVPPGYSLLVSASNSPAVPDPPSDTTPALVIVPSAPSTVPTRADVRAPDVSPAAAVDAIGTLVVSQTEPAARDDADLVHDPPSAAETASSGDEEPVTLTPRIRNASASSSPAEPVAAGSVTLVSSSAATSFSPASATGAATSRLVPASGTDAAASATIMPSSYPPAAPSQVGTASASLSEAAEDVEVASASSAE